jgi:hypothetical protein
MNKIIDPRLIDQGVLECNHTLKQNYADLYELYYFCKKCYYVLPPVPYSELVQ